MSPWSLTNPISLLNKQPPKSKLINTPGMCLYHKPPHLTRPDVSVVVFALYKSSLLLRCACEQPGLVKTCVAIIVFVFNVFRCLCVCAQADKPETNACANAIVCYRRIALFDSEADIGRNTKSSEALYMGVLYVRTAAVLFSFAAQRWLRLLFALPAEWSAAG